MIGFPKPTSEALPMNGFLRGVIHFLLQLGRGLSRWILVQICFYWSQLLWPLKDLGAGKTFIHGNLQKSFAPMPLMRLLAAIDRITGQSVVSQFHGPVVALREHSACTLSEKATGLSRDQSNLCVSRETLQTQVPAGG